MKHLKKFESTDLPFFFTDEKEYSEIFEAEFNDLSIIENKDYFSKNELNEISMMVKHYSIREYGSIHVSIDKNGDFTKPNFGFHLNLMNIVKTKDEYFLVEVRNSKKFLDTNMKYYKCDQLEGLIEFLKDWSIIKNKN